MPEHYTQSTESVTKFCSTCGRITEHIVSAGRIGRCKEHSAPEFTKAQEKARIERAYFLQTSKQTRLGELQSREGIGRNIKEQLQKLPQPEELAPCGNPNCAGCYEIVAILDDGMEVHPLIHPPRSDY